MNNNPFHLEQMLKIDHFPAGRWEGIGLIPSEQEQVTRMNEEVYVFVTFLLSIQDHDENQKAQEIQSWFDVWDDFDFDTEETELIIEVMMEILSKTEFNHWQLLI